MADRVTLVKTVAPGAYAGAGIALTLADADSTDFNRFVASGKDLVIAFQAGVAERAVTIYSVADPYGRTGNLVDPLPAAAATFRMWGPFPCLGWRQVGAVYIYLDGAHAECQFGVVQLP